MLPHEVIIRLHGNAAVFTGLFAAIPEEQARWKPSPDRWSVLEVVCHLYDEERDDFRKRVDLTLHNGGEWPAIDPPAWVHEHRYAEQDFSERCNAFLNERQNSISFLQQLTAPDWDRSYVHPKMGKVTAGDMLNSWLAHDLLHLRQLTRLNWDYLASGSKKISMLYAGNW